MSRPIRYVLITPARNEGQFIELTIQSVIAQTTRPAKWIIVSDGSIDNTEEIVQRYAAEYDWIQLLKLPERRDRNFAGKVHAFNAGYAKLNDEDYDVIGSMDADISFEPDYFSFLLDKLRRDDSLGLVGTPFKDESVYDYRFVSIEHVSGACQLFRRQCFEAIGGYVPVSSGGIDLIAVVTAQMKGWKTRTFTEKVCLHHRKMGSAEHGVLSAWYRLGGKDRALGNHPMWECFRSIYQMSKTPFFLGGLMLMSGFAVASLKNHKRPVSLEFVQFRRREQMDRLKRIVMGGRSREPRAT